MISTVTLNAVLTGSVAPGVYRTRSQPDTLRRATETRGWRFFSIDGHAVHDKATFLQATAEAMAFPSYFGQNWDALFDSICDLSWAPASGYVLLYDYAAAFAEAHPDEWVIAHDILSDATTNWQARGVPFYVLLRRLGERKALKL